VSTGKTTSSSGDPGTHSNIIDGRKVVSTGYTPRPIQHALHLALKRFNVLVMHRRAGKSVFALNHLTHKALKNQLKNPQYAYLAPFYGQARRVAWDYIKMFTANLPGVSVNEADLRVEIERPHLGDKIKIMLLGADNPANLKGIYLDGVILDEYAEMNPSAWREVIRPTLADRTGWAIFIGTPKGRNHFFELWQFAEAADNPGREHWYRAMHKASETRIIPEEELESLRAEMTVEEYEQEFLCSFEAGMVGAYFAREMAKAQEDKRICAVPYERTLAVDTYWDLGINDVAAVWFIQKLGREYRVVDYFQEPDLSIPELVNKTKSMIMEQRAVMGQMYLPHDVQVREMVSGNSRLEKFHSMGLRPDVIPRVETKEDSINAAKMILSKCFFDEVRCKKGLDALRAYQRKWDSKQGVFSTKPLHNFASNGADAFQQFAMAVEEREEIDSSSLPREADSYYYIFTHRG
jgi:phage terminase large subunit